MKAWKDIGAVIDKGIEHKGRERAGRKARKGEEWRGTKGGQVSTRGTKQQ